jgi:hypothetical protein
MQLNQLDPLRDVDVSFHRKAEVFVSHCIFEEHLAPDYIMQQLSGVRAGLIELGAITETAELFGNAAKAAIRNYKKMLEENMYPDDGLFHDDQRIEIFAAMLLDMCSFYRSHPLIRHWAAVIIPMQLLQCGLSLRPSEGLVTNTGALEPADVVDTSFDSAFAAELEEQPAPLPGRRHQRRAFLAQHCVAILGTSQEDCLYVNFCDLGSPRDNPLLPILGIQARARVKNDLKGNRGTRSYGSNPDKADAFCLATPVINLLRRYTPRRGSTIWSGLPGAAEGQGRTYYRRLGHAMRAYAEHRDLDPRRLNLHCNRLYGPQQLALCSEETRGDQGGWTLRAEHAGAKGAQVYYRLHFWNHGMKVRADMHKRHTPLAHLDRHITGIAPSSSKAAKLQRRGEVITAIGGHL